MIRQQHPSRLGLDAGLRRRFADVNLFVAAALQTLVAVIEKRGGESIVDRAQDSPCRKTRGAVNARSGKPEEFSVQTGKGSLKRYFLDRTPIRIRIGLIEPAPRVRFDSRNRRFRQRPETYLHEDSEHTPSCWVNRTCGIVAGVQIAVA